MRTPAIGDWLIPSEGEPGMVVDIMPSGSDAVLARYSPRFGYSETAHKTTTLRGPMRGQPVSPCK